MLGKRFVSDEKIEGGVSVLKNSDFDIKRDSNRRTPASQTSSHLLRNSS